MRRTQLNRGDKPLRRFTYIRHVSDKARDRRPARRAAMEVVMERDKVCQFWPRLQRWGEQMEVRPPLDVEREFMWTFDLKIIPPCWGDLVGHEPEKRSHGADPTDPEQIVLTCVLHNSWVEDHPLAAKALDL